MQFRCFVCNVFIALLLSSGTAVVSLARLPVLFVSPVGKSLVLEQSLLIQPNAVL